MLYEFDRDPFAVAYPYNGPGFDNPVAHRAAFDRFEDRRATGDPDEKQRRIHDEVRRIYED